MSTKHKLGFIDSILEKLPEMHIMGYRYCGPNTNLESRLSCDEICINMLDCACMEHDIAYARSEDLESRCVADKLLVLKAIRCVYSKDSQIGERFAGLIVSFFISIKIIFAKMELCIINFRRYLSSKSKLHEKKKL